MNVSPSCASVCASIPSPDLQMLREYVNDEQESTKNVIMTSLFLGDDS